MAQAQLARFPSVEGRRSERRIVNLAASIREGDAIVAGAEVQNLSVDGFMAETDMALEAGATVWLKLSGQEPRKCEVKWVEDGKAGFAFATPLHPATLELIVSAGRKPLVRGHFGPRR